MDGGTLEPEVTVKEEPEELTENYDFPLVIIKEEPCWDEPVMENPDFK